MAAETAASRRSSGGACPGTTHKLRPLGASWGLGDCVTRRCSSYFFMGATMLVLLVLLPLQPQGISAIVCEIDARDGLEAATASVATAAADRHQLMHMLPLCRVPYLVNSQLPPKDVPHVGMERGGTVTIDLQLLPSDYKNSVPARSPRFTRTARLSITEEETDSGYAAYKRQQQRQQQPYFRQAEEKHQHRNTSSDSSEGVSGEPPTTMLLHTDLREGPLAALSSTFPLLAHARRRLFGVFAPSQQQEPQQQQSQEGPWLSRTFDALTRAAEGGFRFLMTNFVGINNRGSPLLFSSLTPSTASSPPPANAREAAAPDVGRPSAGPKAAAAARAAATAEVAAGVPGASTARMARRRDCEKHLHKRIIGCPEWDGDAPIVVRQLAKIEEEEGFADGMVHSVNNTFLLLLDHSQLYFLETHESWLLSFTAEEAVVLNSYMPSMLRLPLKGPRLQTTITLPYKDRYALVLLNTDGLNLKLQGRISFWGPTQHHLSLEQKHLPEAVAILMVLNLAAACILGLLQLTKWRGHNLIISLLFMANFLLAALAFGLDWRQASIVEATGRRPAALWVASRLMRKLQDVSQLLVFIFVSLGFHIVRYRLSRLEVQFIAGLAVISLYLGIFEVLLGGFQETRYIFHAAGYVRVLIAVHSNIVLLHNQIADSSLTPAVGELYPKLAAYQRFRWIFFAFLLKPVFSVFFKVTFLGPIYEQLLSWDEWIYVLFENGTDFVVVAALCWDFCPPRTFKVLQLVTPETDQSTAPQQRELTWDE